MATHNNGGGSDSNCGGGNSGIESGGAVVLKGIVETVASKHKLSEELQLFLKKLWKRYVVVSCHK
jgi:hypothetical protein